MRAPLMNRVFTTTCSLALIVLLAGPALAGARDHEDGFFMRLSAGGGGANTSIDTDVGDLEISGDAADINFAFGGIVSPNLALHGTLFGWTADHPDGESNGRKAELPGSVTAAGFGVGLTYYVMPSNIYFSGSIGTGRLTFDIDNFGSADSHQGVILDATVGKEWWVGDGWGLGVAAGLTYHSFPEPGVADNWTGTSFAIRFSATMN